MDVCTRVRILSCNKLFTAEGRALIEDAVQRSGLAFEIALQLAKLYFLDLFDDLIIKHGGFNHQVAQLMGCQVDLSSTFFSNVLSVVSNAHVLGEEREGKSVKKRGRPFGASKQQTIRAYEDCYQSHHRRGRLPGKVDGTNLSHVFSYQATQMESVYSTNIHRHFDKYVKRYIHLRVKNAFLDAGHCDTTWDLTREARKEMKAVGNAVVKHVLYGGGEPSILRWALLARSVKMTLLPCNETLNERYLGLKTQPARYFPYMLWIDQLLQTDGGKLFSPCPLRTEFVPKHIVLDTAGLIDLCVKDANRLRSDLELRTGHDLGKFTDKGSFYKNPSKLVEGVCKDTFHAEFKTAMWESLTKMGQGKNEVIGQDGLRFNNLILTNGYKASLVYVDESSYYTKRYEKGVKKRREVVEPFAYIQNLTEGERQSLLEDNIVRLYCDPGKGNLVTIGTGEKRLNSEKKRIDKTVCYTGVQRRAETSQKRNREEHDKWLDMARTSDGMTVREVLGALNETGASSKSCFTECLGRYLQLRVRYGPTLRAFYSQMVHRRRRMRALVGRRSSEDRLLSKIRNTFAEPGKELLIFWGNWGKSPNLKNQPPSPGIGLRRRIHQVIRTYTVDERGTSSCCPIDEGPVDHPVTRTIINRKTNQRRTAEVHHLLRCQNDTCKSRWWQRDVMATVNIRKQTLHVLSTGHGHPAFERKSKPEIKTGTAEEQVGKPRHSKRAPTNRPTKQKRVTAPIALSEQLYVA
jgi:hypothetical protein